LPWLARIWGENNFDQLDLDQTIGALHGIWGVEAFGLHKGIVMFQRKICASIILGLGLLATAGYAQQSAQPEHHQGGGMMGAGRGAMMGGGATMESGGMPMTGMMRMMGENGMGGMMAGHVEGRLAFLKTELKITDVQLPLWEKVADAIRANAKTISTITPGGVMEGGRTGTLPDKLAQREKMMTVHLDALRKFKAAVDPLYAALSPEQKKTADQLLMGPMGMM
jgi:LTXXQ motif family protein